jgi:hypothetical protein
MGKAYNGYDSFYVFDLQNLFSSMSTFETPPLRRRDRFICTPFSLSGILYERSLLSLEVLPIWLCALQLRAPQGGEG